VPGAGNEDEALLEVVEVLGNEEELLAGAMRQAMEKLVAALVAANAETRPPRAVDAALDGTELVARGELTRGNGDQLPLLMPSFVFLVALPIAGEDGALALARRTESLIEEARRDG
jgi:hypothetical protein